MAEVVAAPQPVQLMEDSIEVSTTSVGPYAYAGYISGSWQTFFPLVKQYPHSRHLSIATNAGAKARCLDIERYDAVPSEAPGWRKNNFTILPGDTDGLPVLYTSASSVAAVVGAMTQGGYARSTYLIWSAHYGAGEHICGPTTCGYPQADLTQYDDLYLGRNLDVSAYRDNLFGPVVIPDPHHYGWFATGLEVLGKQHYPLHELDIVEQYDALRPQPARHLARLRTLRTYLNLLADAVLKAHQADVARASATAAEKSWTYRNRGWRFQQLIKRSNNEKLV